MARMKKAEVIEVLKTAGVEFDENGKYNDLCKLLKNLSIVPAPTCRAPEAIPALAGPVRIENRRKRRNTFLADAVRDENDRDFLNNEIGDSKSSGLKRKYKGKIKTITTIKHYDLIDGDWLTEFIIDLKE